MDTTNEEMNSLIENLTDNVNHKKPFILAKYYSSKSLFTEEKEGKKDEKKIKEKKIIKDEKEEEKIFIRYSDDELEDIYSDDKEKEERNENDTYIKLNENENENDDLVEKKGFVHYIIPFYIEKETTNELDYFNIESDEKKIFPFNRELFQFIISNYFELFLRDKEFLTNDKMIRILTLDAEDFNNTFLTKFFRFFLGLFILIPIFIIIFIFSPIITLIVMMITIFKCSSQSFCKAFMFFAIAIWYFVFFLFPIWYFMIIIFLNYLSIIIHFGPKLFYLYFLNGFKSATYYFIYHCKVHCLQI